MRNRMITTASSLFVVLAVTYTGCIPGDDDDAPGEDTVEQGIAIGGYSASGTASATVAATTAKIPVVFAAGETLMIGTQGITGSAFSGDTVLRLRNPALTDLAVSDDVCATQGSRLSFTSPVAAMLTVWAGCFANTACGVAPNQNVVAVSRRIGTYAFAATNTSNATTNTVNQQFFFNGGETARVSTCGAEAAGASATNDTVLRLFRNTGGVFTEVASNNNAISTCGCGSASLIKFTIPSAGFYEVRAGCALNGSCSGTVAIYNE
jgi:hypothetical protein